MPLVQILLVQFASTMLIPLMPDGSYWLMIGWHFSTALSSLCPSLYLVSRHLEKKS